MRLEIYKTAEDSYQPPLIRSTLKELISWAYRVKIKNKHIDGGVLHDVDKFESEYDPTYMIWCKYPKYTVRLECALSNLTGSYVSGYLCCHKMVDVWRLRSKPIRLDLASPPIRVANLLMHRMPHAAGSRQHPNLREVLEKYGVDYSGEYLPLKNFRRFIRDLQKIRLKNCRRRK